MEVPAGRCRLEGSKVVSDAVKGILKVSRGTDGEVLAEWRPENSAEGSVECTRLGKGGKARRIGPGGRTMLLEADDKSQRVVVWLQSASSNAQELHLILRQPYGSLPPVSISSPIELISVSPLVLGKSSLLHSLPAASDYCITFWLYLVDACTPSRALLSVIPVADTPLFTMHVEECSVYISVGTNKSSALPHSLYTWTMLSLRYIASTCTLTLTLPPSSALTSLSLPYSPNSPPLRAIQLGDDRPSPFSLVCLLHLSSAPLSFPPAPPSYPPNISHRPSTRTTPLASFASLLRWRPDSMRDALTVCSVSLALRGTSRAKGEMLLCHDMKGGYIGDEAALIGQKAAVDPFIFTQWDKIDAFVYFSHTRVTIPPVGWVEAAHRHGVIVYGTVICEGDDGQRDTLQLLDATIGAQIADALVDMCVHYGFDGWFINLEASLPPSHASLAPLLVTWLALLTQKMRAANPRYRVSWYDAITTTGKVQWQNALTVANKPFLDVCDSIFLNYAWNPRLLQQSAFLAAARSRSVYVGTDVFGRGTYGGGGFNSASAAQEAYNHGLSAALFAPGWTVENFARGSATMAALGEKALWDGWLLQQVLQGVEVGGSGKWELRGGGREGKAHGWKEVIADGIASERLSLIASHEWCCASQTVHLSKLFPATLLAASPPLVARIAVKGTGPNYADPYRIRVTLFGEEDKTLELWDSGECTATEQWQSLTRTFHGYPSGVRAVRFEFQGKDREQWAGNFGSQFGNMELMLCIPPSLQSHLPLSTNRGVLLNGKQLISELPLYSSFCDGSGDAFYLLGSTVRAAKWTNVRFQQLQPVSQYEGQQSEARISLWRHSTQAWNGGSCLRFSGLISSCGAALINLFNCADLQCAERACVTLVYRLRAATSNVGLFLSRSHQPSIALVPGSTAQILKQCSLSALQGVQCISDDSTEQLNGWYISRWAIPASRISQISALCYTNSAERNSNSTFDALLGHISVSMPSPPPPPPAAILHSLSFAPETLLTSVLPTPRGGFFPPSPYFKFQDSSGTVSVDLKWQSVPTAVNYHLWIDDEWLGCVPCPAYFISQLSQSRKISIAAVDASSRISERASTVIHL